MSCKGKKPEPTTRRGQILQQMRGSRWLVNIPGVGVIQVQGQNASLRPTMTVTAVQAGGVWRVV